METTSLQLSDPTPLREIDSIAQEYHSIVSGSTAQFERMAITANAIAELKKRMPDALVEKLSRLAGSRLGYRTDKDTRGGYTIEETRNCLIEAALMDVRVIGNEFNIIAGNLYVTLEGYRGKMARDPLFGSVVINTKSPRIDGNRAIIEYTAKWTHAGEKHSIDGEVPVKRHNTDSDDMSLGKAERKIRKLIWEISKGSSLPDGDVSEVDVSKLPSANIQAAKNAEIAKPIDPTKPPVDAVAKPDEPAQEPKPESVSSALDELTGRCEAAGIQPETLNAYAKDTGFKLTSESDCQKILNGWGTLEKMLITRQGAKQQPSTLF